ncbi:copper amine oxidase [Cellulomonas sp. Y8]|uniref:copper amine oxidase n=1 Tax=Cellulomonas sp. Y8 TaxID=2591145 RepID=UPI0011C95443|nr:copper amine oxidase [Cellulomonas sp. Y8]
MRRTRSTYAVAAMAAGLTLSLTLAACSSTDDTATGTTPSASSSMEMGSGHDGMDSVEPVSTGDPFADARTAAAHMPETGLTLATGLAAATDTAGEVDSDAATLRAGLTALLQEHVYLTGIGVATAYTAGADSAEFMAAKAALDGNTDDLADAVGSLAGEEQGAAFHDLWDEHIGYFVDYAVAVKSGDQAAADAAQASLAGYTTQAGAFFEQISAGNLPADAVAEALTMHVTTLTAAIDALAAGEPTASDTLKAAADHVGMDAATIATGLAAGAGLSGDAMDDASTLRSTLTALLQEHVYLASYAVFTAYTAEGGVDSPAFTAAAATLDANSVALSDAVTSLAGEENGAAFLDLWREHIGFFVDYAVADATGDEDGRQQALADLDGYRPEAGAFFEKVSNGELPADDVAAGLGMHVSTLAGAIDSLAAALVP